MTDTTVPAGMTRSAYTVAEVAAQIGVSPQVVRRLCRSGRLRSVRTGENGGGARVITPAAVRDYLQGSAS